MYIKNISQLLKLTPTLGNKLQEGTTLSGKLLSIENNKGTIKLYDGTIIPAIFISENDVDKDNFNKFMITGFDGENYSVRQLQSGNDSASKTEKSMDSILKDLHIPMDDGKKIIMSLIKYNLPATNENINKIYKSLSFVNNIKDMGDEEILQFLKRQVGEEIEQDQPEFSIAKDMFSSLRKVDEDFLSFLLENDIDPTPEDIGKAQNFLSNKLLLNSFIDAIKTTAGDHSTENPIAKLQQLMDSLPANEEKLIVEALLNNLHQSIAGSKGKLSVATLQETIELFKGTRELFKFESDTSYKKLMDNLDILKKLDNNYSMYFFNLYDVNNLFRNNLIIKHKYKNSKYIDINDVKAYLSVDTKMLGLVEGNLYKRNSDISIAFNVNSEHVPFFQSNTNVLKKTLKALGYQIVNLSVEPHKADGNALPFSDFFNESVLRELDVKV